MGLWRGLEGSCGAVGDVWCGQMRSHYPDSVSGGKLGKLYWGDMGLGEVYWGDMGLCGVLG
jgi:hypothetical protein